MKKMMKNDENGQTSINFCFKSASWPLIAEAGAPFTTWEQLPTQVASTTALPVVAAQVLPRTN